jgi:hypothetical protein
MAASIRGAATAGTQPLVALTFRALVALGDKLGGPETAGRWLIDPVNETGKPVAVNIPTPDGNSTTQFFAPFGWTRERLLGFVAGFAPELESTFGAVAGIRGEGGAR